MKDFITTQDWSKEDLDSLLELTKDMKQNPKKYQNKLSDKSLCMFFYNPSTRTRNSTQVAAYQLGMLSVLNGIKDSWMGYQSESIKDTSIVLSNYYNAIGIRIFPNAVNWKYKEANRIVREFAKWSKVPIINFEDDQFHPLQALTDIYTIKEKKKQTENKKITISWAYHPKPLPLSVPNSTLLITTRYGMDVTLAHPKGFELDNEIIAQAQKNSQEFGGALNFSNDIRESYENADVIYVKSWGARSAYGDARKEKSLRMPYRDNWMIKSEYLDNTNKNSIFMHCLPIRRNLVADDETVDGSHSIVYDQAENRLYTIKALLYNLLND
ncbi:MAG: N-acetylornithine carbamoyltransferase [Candidatus Lokiarchaeota archaeon]|nr:N-acetylornithine carbamoyltransferase [Candidatus Lokiarchaeota archaeon]